MDAAKARCILDAARSSMGEQKPFLLRFLSTNQAPFLPTSDHRLSLVVTQGGRVALS